MTTFYELDGKFSFKTRVVTRNGIEQKILPYLWHSEEEAKNDVELYKYLKKDPRVRKKNNEPDIPENVLDKTWFENVKPDDSWNIIRDFLNPNDIPTIAVVTIKKRKYEKISNQVHYRSELNKKYNYVTTALFPKLIEDNILVQAEIRNQITTSSAIANILDNAGVGPMRKAFTAVAPRRQQLIKETMVKTFKEIWFQIAPNQSMEQFFACISNTFLDINHDTFIVECMKTAYANASVNNDRELQIQYLSLFTNRKEVTITKLSAILGVSIPYKMFRNASYHAKNYGPGKIIEKSFSPRNVEKKIEIIEMFVDYLIKQGII